MQLHLLQGQHPIILVVHGYASTDKMFYFAEPALIAKSNIILDVKPWDDETDMQKMEEYVRSIQADGLLWGACKF